MAKKASTRLPSEAKVVSLLASLLTAWRPPATSVGRAVRLLELTVAAVREIDPENKLSRDQVRQLMDKILKVASGPNFQLTTEMRVYLP